MVRCPISPSLSSLIVCADVLIVAAPFRRLSPGRQQRVLGGQPVFRHTAAAASRPRQHLSAEKRRKLSRPSPANTKPTDVEDEAAADKLAPLMLCPDLGALRRQLAPQQGSGQWAAVQQVDQPLLIVADAIVAEQLLRTAAAEWGDSSRLVVLGGAADGSLGSALTDLAETAGLRVAVPPAQLEGIGMALLWSWPECRHFVTRLLAGGGTSCVGGGLGGEDLSSTAGSSCRRTEGSIGRRVRLQLVLPSGAADQDAAAVAARNWMGAGAAEVFALAEGGNVTLARGIRRAQRS